MEITAQQLWDRIEKSGLASAATCQSWANTIALAVGSTNAHDARRVASELIRTRKLTPYQCNILFEQESSTLRVGNYAIVDSLQDSLGSNWVEVKDLRLANQPDKQPSTPTEGAATRNSCWAFLLSSAGLKNEIIKAFPPSLEMASAHLQVRGPTRENWTLDRWGEIQTLDGAILATLAPYSGISLKTRLESGPMSEEEANSIVQRIASALKLLHESKLIHGSISPKAVILEDGNNVILRRDILFPPSTPYFERSVSMLGLTAIERYALSAPELSVARSTDAKQGISPSVATDLYALGVLWATLLVGDTPWTGYQKLNVAGWTDAHRNRAVELPKNLSERTLQAIQQLTCKIPSRRFASADELLAMLSAPTAKTTAKTTAKPTATSVAAANVTSTKKVAKEQDSSAKDAIASDSIRKAPPGEIDSEKKVAAKKLPSSSSHPTEQIKKQADTPKPSTHPAPAEAPNNTDDDFANLFQPSSPVIATARKKGRKPSNLGSKKSDRPKWLVPAAIGGSVLVLGGIGALTALNWSSSSPPPGAVASNSANSSSGTHQAGAITENLAPSGSGEAGGSPQTASDMNGLAERFTPLEDDGNRPWLPPQPPDPYSLELLPLGAELFLAMSGEVWRGEGQGSDLATWLHESFPEWQAFHQEIDVAAVSTAGSAPGGSAAKVAEAMIALYPDTTNNSFWPVVRLRFDSPIAAATVLESFEGHIPQPFEGDNTRGIFTKDQYGIAFENTTLDSSQNISSLVYGPVEVLDTLIDTQGGVAPLRRQLEVLLENSNRNSDLYLLAAPSFIRGNGRSLLESATQLSEATQSLLSERVQSISYAATLQPQWYSELRLTLTDGTTLQRTAGELKRQFEELPNIVEKSFANAPPPPYWSVIALRYPFMLRAVAKQTRWGVEDGQIIANTYLPPSSLSNLVVGTWMTLQGPLNATVADSQPATAKPTPSVPLEQLLDRPLSIAFAQESLEMGLAAIATEFNDTVMKGATPVEFVINGSAFQKEGITQNQQVRDFEHSNKPLQEILTDLVRRANPVTTVQSPTEKDQKVVWLIKEDPSKPGSKRIELTTRTWATDNNVPLPAIFVAPQ